MDLQRTSLAKTCIRIEVSARLTFFSKTRWQLESSRGLKPIVRYAVHLVFPVILGGLKNAEFASHRNRLERENAKVDEEKEKEIDEIEQV
jgi:hypothetical protein